jgi:AraC family transcriptional regulator of adaptative response/methylated-DNA-[protein]-cysteine methyltransferase
MSPRQRGDFDAWMQELARRIEGGPPAVELPLDVRGTAFQLKVWKALLEIPRGAVASYGEIARQVGEPRAVRAVANACAANRIAVLIPCHRVIRGDGSLGGYRWGLARKRTLIDRERTAS